MDDQFIRDYRKPPHSGAIRTLQNKFYFYERNEDRRSSTKKRSIMISFIIIFLALVLTPIISPSVKGQIEEWISQIGGMFVKETNNYPGGDELFSTLPNKELSLDEANAQLPFTIVLPGWLPEGFNLLTNVKVTQFNDIATTAHIDWETPSRSILSLIITKRDDGNPGSFIIGEGKSEEVIVNGQLGALFRGAWNANTKLWDPKIDLLTLSWQRNGLTYSLQGLGVDVSMGDLVRIAESIP